MRTRPEPAGRPLGVYVHWPYCARICPYCDFNVVRDRGRTDEQTALARAIVADLAGHAALTGPRALASIFFGGGTPSLMDPEAVARVIEAAHAHWPSARDVEVTLEANPTDAETTRFGGLRQGGVNRLSLGVQSLDDAALRRLGRNHDAMAARRAIDVGRDLFDRLSIDLIYALPGQSVAAWERELRAVAALGTEHLSPYQLTIEAGTAFHRAVRRRALMMPPPDLSADLFDTTQAVLGEAGFEAYEVSNHARGAAARSRHNLIYWRGGDYLGVGPGAHGRLTLGDGRWASIAPNGVADYIARVNATGTGSDRSQLSARDVALERLLMGLRTVEGVALGDLSPLAIPPTRIAGLKGMIEVEAGRMRATPAGRPLTDRLIGDLLGAL